MLQRHIIATETVESEHKLQLLAQALTEEQSRARICSEELQECKKQVETEALDRISARARAQHLNQLCTMLQTQQSKLKDQVQSSELAQTTLKREQHLLTTTNQELKSLSLRLNARIEQLSADLNVCQQRLVVSMQKQEISALEVLKTNRQLEHVRLANAHSGDAMAVAQHATLMVSDVKFKLVNGYHENQTNLKIQKEFNSLSTTVMELKTSLHSNQRDRTSSFDQIQRMRQDLIAATTRCASNSSDYTHTATK